MIYDVNFGHVVEAENEEDAVRKAAMYFLQDEHASALVGKHLPGDPFGQHLDTVIRIRDGAKSKIPGGKKS